jgi:hypothetical protein
MLGAELVVLLSKGRGDQLLIRLLEDMVQTEE